MGIENLLAQGYQPTRIEPYGNALMRAQQYKAAQQQNALAQMQGEDMHAQRALALQQAKQAAEQQAQQAAWRRSLPQPQGDPRLQALRGGVDVGAVSPVDFLKEAYPQQAPAKTHVVGGALVEHGPAGVKELYKTAEKEPEEVRLLKQVYGDGTPEFKSALRMLATKKTTHAPAATQITYGSPVPIIGPDGQIHYAQPGNRPGAQPQIMTGPDGKPLQKPGGAEKEPTEGERKAATLLQRLRGSQSQLSQALKAAPDAAKPGIGSEVARKVGGDTAANLTMPAARQQVEAAQLDMLDAALTLATGAAYTKEQLQGHRRSYFPQIGDDAKTVADKQVRLKNVISAAEIAAGRAAKGVPKFDSADGAFSDAEKERRYQEWKAKQK